MLTGGALGLREKYESIISRVQSFGAYHFNLDTYPVVSRLFQVGVKKLNVRQQYSLSRFIDNLHAPTLRMQRL